ncbi:MFS transporter [Kitasatospora purpeofusca]|uniref:MFS transporter n=2 Tax=Kitasatospora purpeofusca TaxID=67352 RepID=UPI003818B906
MTPAAAPPIASPPTRAIAVLCLVQVLVALEFSIANVALPTLADDFDVAARDLQWVLSGYALAYGATLLCGGRLADAHGPRRALLTGLTCFTTAPTPRESHEAPHPPCPVRSPRGPDRLHERRARPQGRAVRAGRRLHE